MPRTFTRQELYDLVWSEPMKDLAKRLGLSDTGLAKACKRSEIPRPPRGYWNKLAAGKKVIRVSLPTRKPGMSDEVRVGYRHYGYYPNPSKEEIVGTDWQAPKFECGLDDMARNIRKGVPKVAVPQFPERAHRLLRKYLEADHQRSVKQAASPYSWDEPIFDSPFEFRRLRILNAVFTALSKEGMTPSVQGREARETGVRIHDTLVNFILDDPTASDRRHHWRLPEKNRETSGPLRFTIKRNWRSHETELIWEDAKGSKLEKHLSDIVAELIVEGERTYREGQQYNYEWMVERKTQILEDRRKRKEEEERKERERRAALERARIDRLLDDAQAFRQAKDIRAFVADVEQHCPVGNSSVSDSEFENWKTWALDQAERIDPVRSGRFFESESVELPDNWKPD